MINSLWNMAMSYDIGLVPEREGKYDSTIKRC